MTVRLKLRYTSAKTPCNDGSIAGIYIAARLLYAYIEQRAQQWNIHELCKAVGVSESGYYRYLRRKSRPNRDTLLSAMMQEILDEHPENKNYSAPRMQ